MSKQQPVLSVVPESESALSPARLRLVRGLCAPRSRRRCIRRSDPSNTVAIEDLIVDTKPFEDRIAQLEAENAITIEQWALAGESAEPPKLPHTAEIERLKSELHQPIPSPRVPAQHLPVWTRSCRPASKTACVRSRPSSPQRDMVLVDEIAAEFANTSWPLGRTRRVAARGFESPPTCTFSLKALAVGHIGNLANTVGTMIPRSPDPADFDREAGREVGRALLASVH